MRQSAQSEDKFNAFLEYLNTTSSTELEHQSLPSEMTKREHGSLARNPPPFAHDPLNEQSDDAEESAHDSLKPSNYLMVSILSRHDYNLIVTTARTKGYDEAIETAFDKLKRGRAGHLSQCDIVAFFQTAAASTKLAAQEGGNSIIEAAVAALLHDVAGESDRQDITLTQFRDIFERNPTLLSVFEDDVALAKRIDLVSSQITLDHEAFKEDEEESILKKCTMEARYQRNKWRNRWIALFWTISYIALILYAFMSKAKVYIDDEKARAVFGMCIVVARGSANALNYNAFLVLLFTCKHFMTILRSTPVRHCFPFNEVQQGHILIGIVFGILALSHTLAHICDIHRLAKADVNIINDLFSGIINSHENIRKFLPESYAGRWAYMLSSRSGITGIIMIFCLTIAYFFAFNRANYGFNKFWYSHHLLLIMLLLLCVHGTGHLFKLSKSLYWVIGPLFLYVVPRFLRETPMSRVDIVRAEVKKGDVVQLQLRKPKYYDWYISSGMYGLLNLPEVSLTEWHPFTLTSAPSDEYIEMHFRNAGDWTKKVKDLIKSKTDMREPTGLKNPPIVKLEGPIGASSQGFSDHSIIVLVGAGIGITPMISVLRQLLVSPGKVRRCFFYWTTRDRASFLWFADLINDIYKSDEKHIIQTRYFLTSMKHDDRDLAAVLLHYATRAHHKRTNIDLLLGHQTHHQVEVGRPDWLEEMEGVREEVEALGETKCGIFFCGPTAMAEAVYDASVTVSNKNCHMYFSKETF